MSIELNVYSRRDLLTRELLACECNSPDLPEEFRWEIRFLREADGSLDPDQTRRLQPAQDVVGWPTVSASAAAVREAFSGNDRNSLMRLYQAGAYGHVELFLLTKDCAEWSEIIDPGYLESIPEEHQDTVAHATARYSVETHASRNETSLEFQQHLWRMIGVLTGGLLEDPQEGEYEDCAEDEATA